MPLKAVLFDMDGVIVDTEPLHRKAYFKTFEHLRIDVSEELYVSFTGFSTKKVCETLINNFNLKESVEEISARKRKYFKDYFDHDSEFDLLPGVLDLIKNYFENGITLILASSASENTINWVFERFNLEAYFSGKISGASLKESKPHPEIFEIAAKMSGENKDNCLVIEDSTNGILAAHSAGIFCVAYKSEHSTDQIYDKANHIISEFSEIKIPNIHSIFTD